MEVRSRRSDGSRCAWLAESRDTCDNIVVMRTFEGRSILAMITHRVKEKTSRWHRIDDLEGQKLVGFAR